LLDDLLDWHGGDCSKRSTLSTDVRRRITAAQRARWAKLKAGKKS